jgi:hypothetical protein
LIADVGASFDFHWRNPQSLSTLPFIPISFVKKGKTLNFFSMVTTVGTPLSITAQELRIECFSVVLTFDRMKAGLIK